ncbi:putative glycosyl transferase FCK3 [Paramyrothecium foliicola]|nr:putative glycosyl transferase FCK3 [Paramyrothecium foliicola]
MSRFEIPLEYQDRLEVVEPHDQRSNDEILQSLGEYTPVTSEKNVWAFWHSGVSNMPAWCQRNVIDWVRICSPDWTIRVLDNVPESPNYALKYLDQNLLVQTFVERTMDGKFVGQHGADLVRGATLVQYGGVWMDVGSILTRHLDRVCWDRLQDPSDPYQVAVTVRPNHGIINYFVACRKGDPFIRYWHELFCSLWEGRTNLHGIIDHPLVSFLKHVSEEQLAAAEDDMGLALKVSMTELAEYAIQVFIWTRLTLLDEATADGFCYADYWRKNIMRIDLSEETLQIETILGFGSPGQLTLDLLSTRLDADKDSEQYRLAEKAVWLVLSQSSMQKIYRGGKLFAELQLGSLLDLTENAGKDCAPGTFAELLRYGTIHFRQKRPQISIRSPEAPEARVALVYKDFLNPAQNSDGIMA